MTLLLKMDIRETQETLDSVQGFMSTKGVDTYVDFLATGDFAVGNLIGIERKRWDDLVGSVADGRVFQQATEMSQTYAQSYILVDGSVEEVVYNGRLSSQSMFGAIASLTCHYHTPVIFAGSEFNEMLYWLVLKATDGKTIMDYTPIRRQAPTKDHQVHFLTSLPGIGSEKAKRILKIYKTPAYAIANYEKWTEVDGIGPATVEKIGKVLTEES